MSDNNSSTGTPLVSCSKLHDQISNCQDEPLILSDSLFKNAEDFFQASEILLQQGFDLFTVAYANMAFSCELYLKSILFQDKSDCNRINQHNLHLLYNMLSPEKQAEIKERCDFRYESNERFEAFLKEVSEMYVITRYIHENKSGSLSLDFQNLVMAVRNCSKLIYNKRVLDRNEDAQRKLEEFKSSNLDSSLEFYIYYSEGAICDMKIVAEKFVENLCLSLKNDYCNYKLGNKNDDWVKEPAIILYFTRQTYIYSFEYDSIVETTQSVLKRYGVTSKGLRTNGYNVKIEPIVV